jgi:hypothetical protein
MQTMAREPAMSATDDGPQVTNRQDELAEPPAPLGGNAQARASVAAHSATRSNGQPELGRHPQSGCTRSGHPDSRHCVA